MDFESRLPNVVTSGDGFHVSYNNHDYGIYGCDTTALVLGQMEKFYILKGDHRARYKPLIPRGLDACLSYFAEHLAEAHKMSDKFEPARTDVAPEDDQTSGTPFQP